MKGKILIWIGVMLIVTNVVLAQCDKPPITIKGKQYTCDHVWSAEDLVSASSVYGGYATAAVYVSANGDQIALATKTDGTRQILEPTADGKTNILASDVPTTTQQWNPDIAFGNYIKEHPDLSGGGVVSDTVNKVTGFFKRRQVATETTPFGGSVNYDPSSQSYTITEKDQTVSIPVFFLGTDSKGKPLTGDAVAKLLQNAGFNEDGSFTFTIDRKAAKKTDLDRGTWKVTKNADKSETWSRDGGTVFHPFSTDFTVRDAGGNTVVTNSKGLEKQTIYAKDGTELYSCDNAAAALHFCGKIDVCNAAFSHTTDCYEPGDQNKPIIITRGPGTQCFSGGASMTYDTDTKACYSVNRDVAGFSNITIATDAGPKSYLYDASTGKFYSDYICKKTGGQAPATAPASPFPVTTAAVASKTISCSGTEAKDTELDPRFKEEAKLQLFEKELSEGISEAISMAGVGSKLYQLGYQYGWWKGDLGALSYEKWFEDSVLLRAITAPDRYFCEELNTDFSDIMKDGFLPTASGMAGADIQAKRYAVKEINITTLNETSFYRYKVNFNVDGAAIFKTVAVSFQGKPLEEYKTKIQVFLDSYSITEVIELSTKDRPSYGTPSVGHPILIKSDKLLKTACIKFENTGDLDPWVAAHIKENDNEICNDVVNAYVPRIIIPEITGENQTGAGTGGGGGGGGGAEPLIPPNETTI